MFRRAIQFLFISYAKALSLYGIMERVFSLLLDQNTCSIFIQEFHGVSLNSQTHWFYYTVCPGNNSRKSQPHPCLFIFKASLCTYKTLRRAPVAPRPLVPPLSLRPARVSHAVLPGVCVRGEIKCGSDNELYRQ